MTTTVELTRFRVAPERTGELLAARPGMLAGFREGRPGFLGARLHALTEVELAASGLGWTVARPAFFMQNLFGSVSGGILYGPTGEGRMSLIDVRDIAAFSARVLADPGPHHGRTYTITGPESISLREAAARIGAGYQPVSPEDAHQAMLQAGLPEWDAAVNVEYARAYARNWGDYVTGDFAEVMGRAARTFDEFAADHRERLGG
jgi:uncharacterized protein YbjT (DUF2867 family)